MGSIKIKLPNELTIFNIEEFWKNLVDTLEKMNKGDEKSLVLDFKVLEKIDGSGIQLLISLEKTILKERFQVKYENVNVSIEETLKLVGVEYLLVSEGEKNE